MKREYQHAMPRSTPRSTEDGPWLWANKVAVRRIRDVFDTDNAVASALGVYMALCEISSDEKSPSVQTTQHYIAMKCGFSRRTVQCRIDDLAGLGFIRVHTPDRRMPSFYTLLKVDGPEARNHCHPGSNGCHPGSNSRKQASLRRSEERSEECTEENRRKTLSTGGKTPSLKEWQQRATEIGWTDGEDVTKCWNDLEAFGWLIDGQRVLNWRSLQDSRKTSNQRFNHSRKNGFTRRPPAQPSTPTRTTKRTKF